MGRIRFCWQILQSHPWHPKMFMTTDVMSLSQKCGFCGGIPCGKPSSHFKATPGFFLLPHLAEYLQEKKVKGCCQTDLSLIFQVLDNVAFSKEMKKVWWFLFFALAGRVQQSFTPAGNFPTCLSVKNGISSLLGGEFNKPVKPLTTQVGGRSQQRGI